MNRVFFKVLYVAVAVLGTSIFSHASDVDGQIPVEEAREIKVDENGVVVDLREGESLRYLPTVVYDGNNSQVLDSTAIYYDVDSGVEVLEDGVVYASSGIDGAMTLSIDDAEMMAINYSPTLKQALTGKMTAKGRRIGAIGGALPSLGVTGSSTWSQERKFESNYSPIQDTPSERNTSLYGLSVTQPLFKGGSIIATIRNSKLYEEWVSEDIRTSRQAVVKTIRTQYYNTLYAEKLTEIYQEQAEISKEYWEKTKRRYEADDVPEIEVLKYEVQYKIAEANYIQAKSSYDSERVNILRLIGAPLDTNLTLSTSLDFAEIDPGDEKTLTAQAIASRPELKASKLNEEMQKQQIKVAKSALYPEISAVASWGQTNRWSSTAGVADRGTDWSWSAGLQMNWNILAGGGQTVRSSIIQAKAILDKYEFATEDTVDTIKEEVKTSLLSLTSAIDWVKSQKENVEQAERVLKQETIKWDEGAGDYLDILDARNTLAQTQQLYWQGVTSYKTSVVNLEYAIGKYQTETDSIVQGYRVVKNRSGKRIKKKKNKFSDQSIIDSFNALATPDDLKKKKIAKENSTFGKNFKMNVVPARVDKQIGFAKPVDSSVGLPRRAGKGKAIEVIESKEEIAGPELVY